jgi:hypothetical protein
MVQPANRKGRESGSGMKGEVVSSILPGSTIRILGSDSARANFSQRDCFKAPALICSAAHCYSTAEGAYKSIGSNDVRITRAARRPLAGYHEAGHCVARWFFGYDIHAAGVLTEEEVRRGVTVKSHRGVVTGDLEGYVDGAPINTPGLLREEVEGIKDPGNRERVLSETTARNEIALIEAFAGVAAEARYTKRSIAACLFIHGQGDQELADRISVDWWPDHGRDRAAAMETAQARARALVGSSKGWTAVCAIAPILLQRGRLPGTKVAALCRRAFDGQQPAHGSWIKHWPPTLEQLRKGIFPMSLGGR